MPERCYLSVCSNRSKSAVVNARRDSSRTLRQAGSVVKATANGPSPAGGVARSRAALQSLVDANGVNETSLMRLLGDREKAPSAEVRTDGLPFATAHALTAPFVVLPDYGTRCSTILKRYSDGKLEITERTFMMDGTSPGQIPPGKDRVFSFYPGIHS